MTMKIGNGHFDACVGSGAIYILTLKQVYDLLSRKEVGPCEESNVVLMGVSGKNIPTDGFACTHLWTCKLHYKYPILMVELAVIDILLGLDWLIAVRAVINFFQMTTV